MIPASDLAQRLGLDALIMKPHKVCSFMKKDRQEARKVGGLPKAKEFSWTPQVPS